MPPCSSCSRSVFQEHPHPHSGPTTQLAPHPCRPCAPTLNGHSPCSPHLIPHPCPAQTAQALYEGKNTRAGGLITYMRTDGTQISPTALGSIRECVGKHFGQDCVPDSPRLYKTRRKNAQEAHEAIRPTDALRTPAEVAGMGLPADQVDSPHCTLQRCGGEGWACLEGGIQCHTTVWH